MKTKLLTALLVTFLLSGVLLPGKADAQKTKHEKVVIRSSDGKSMQLGSLRDTTIISKDGKDTTIILNTTDGKEKKITVRKIISSGSDKDATLYVDAETGEPGDEELSEMMQCMPKCEKSCKLKIVKMTGNEGEPGSYIIKECGPGGFSDIEDISFDEPLSAGHSCKVIRGGCGDFESAGDGKIIVIILNDDSNKRCCKMKRHRSKHQKIYVINGD
ncbi:MAG: hypothetical protein WCM93_06830 [Bacteroidota bacterium]